MNHNRPDFYKTTLTFEIEVDTQFGPLDAIDLVSCHLIQYPAIKSLIVTKVDTNYVLFSPLDAQRKASENLPHKLK